MLRVGGIVVDDPGRMQTMWPVQLFQFDLGPDSLFRTLALRLGRCFSSRLLGLKCKIVDNSCDVVIYMALRT